MDFGYKIDKVKNYALTDESTEIIAPEAYEFSKIICTTSDGSAFLIAHEEDGDTFPISEVRGTMPMLLDAKNTMGGTTTLFFAEVASGTATLTITFIKK